MSEGGVTAALVSAGIICLIAAVIGGGLKGLGFELPALRSLHRQALLGGLGAILLVVGLSLPILSKRDGKDPPYTPTPTPSASPMATPTPTPTPDEEETAATGGLDGFCNPPTQEAQRLLHQIGYYDGAIDGCAGPVTRAAIERFQREEELINSARADTATLEALRRRAGVR